MAEQVNQRIEDMINELEQMRRTNLFDDEEIKEISRKRKEFEYQVQRRVKQKEDYVQYIAYELALLEDISLRRKKAKLGEKKNDVEYAITARLNRLFKQFITRFQNDIEIYFEYIKFCMSVGFEHSVSTIIGPMLQIHGDKPKVWQMASKWELKELNNIENARNFLLGGIKRHPDSDILYLDLFQLELCNAFAQDGEEKEKGLKRAIVTWKNGAKNINDVKFLFKLCDISVKYGVDSVTCEIQQEIWSRRKEKDVWSYIASKELEECHWEQIKELMDDDDENEFPKLIRYVKAVYEEALQQFMDKNLCKKYIKTLLGASDRVCNDLQKVAAVKHAWLFGHENGLLTNDMYAFGIEMLKLENEMSNQELTEILDTAAKLNPKARYIWEERLNMCKSDKEILLVLEKASKTLTHGDVLFLWNMAADNITSKVVLQNMYKRFQYCENIALLPIKGKLLQKMYDISGLKAARELYEELVRTPPTQLEVHRIMIDIEASQPVPNAKVIRKCYELAVQHHGADSVEVWTDYIKFETTNGNVANTPAIYRRAVAVLKKNLVDEFIKIQTLAKLS